MTPMELLQSLLRWTNRADGAFVEALPRTIPLPDSDTLRNAFTAIGVTNAVGPMVRQVLEKAEPGFQRVGPRFEFEDHNATPLRLRILDMTASVNVSADMLKQQSRVLSPIEIEELLTLGGVVYGIDPDLVGMLCRPTVANGWYDVAMGDPPVDGLDAHVRVLVDMSQATIHHDDEGTVDMHEVGRILEIVEGTAIVEKIPVVPCKHGRDLGGNVLTAKEGKDIPIKLGGNTRFREGGETIIESATDGYLFQKDGNIHVGRVFEIRGDLDLATGNMRYHGDIKIYGGVKPGFHIEAGGDVWIQGQAEQAEISSAKGKIEVLGAVIGGKLHAATSIKIPFAHDSELHCQGLVEVTKYLHFCNVHCTDLKLVNAGAFVLGGEVLASHSIELDVAGTESGTQTILKLADPEEELAHRELEAVAAEERRFAPVREVLEPKVMMIKKRLTTGGGLLGKAREDAEETIRQYSAVMEKLHTLLARREKAQNTLTQQRQHQGVVSIRQRFQLGAELFIFGKKVPPESIHPPVRVISRGLEIEVTKN
jgi:uncharacterized protein (DUF342 family)